TSIDGAKAGTRGPSGDGSRGCSSSTYERAASMLGDANIEDTYALLEQTSCSETEPGHERLPILKILISVSEVAASHETSSALREFTKGSMAPGLSDVNARVGRQQRLWATRLSEDSRGLAKLRNGHVSLIFDNLP